jgi:NAD-dependent deacetylase
MFLALSGLLGFLNLPVLTLPFNLTILLLVTAAVRMGPLRSGLIPVPLDRITTPEKAIRSKRPLLGPYPQTPGFRQAAGFFRSFLPGCRPTPEEAARLAEAIRTAPSVAILSGAGTSTESGIPDFRDNPAFWLRFGAEEMTYGNFLSRPDVRERYWEMQRQFHRLIEEARPNDIHRTAVRLQEMGKLACVVTQNVDGLFQKAGVSPERVIEVHGSIRTARCTGCRTVHTDAEIEAMLGAGIAAPFCRSCRQPLKPDTIFMGEPLDEAVAGEALFGILSAGLLLVVGTSLQVDPVASFADLAWRKGVRIAVVNLQPTPKDGLAEIVVRKPLGPVFRKVLRELAGC